MEFTILSTKLNIPAPSAELVARPRLVERLNAGIDRKLTLISAPAGFGKTTLMSEWISQLDGTFRLAWLTLDEADNDIARFIAYLVEALRKADSELEKTIPDPSQPLAINTKTILDSVLNAIAGMSIPLLLVLDDYHLIEAQAVHEVAQYILTHQPSQLHLVIATRADPPLRLARLRGQGQLNELRLEDLRFSREEADIFLRRMTGEQISTSDVDSLINRTEGWIAGLQMAAISMRLRGDVEGFVQSFTGNNRFILDYLTEEVLQRQPEEVQDFLLKTSILERLSGSLCDTVWEVQEKGSRVSLDFPGTYQGLRPKGIFRSPSASSEILEYLERSNLFLISLDDRRVWYRYHQLFADLLQARLTQTQPEWIPGLHQRASQWFERSGYLSEAIEHALAAQDFQRAALLIAQVAEATLKRSEVMTLSRWLDRLPEVQVRAYPDLIAYHAWALLLSGRPLEEVQACLESHSVESGSRSARSLPLFAFLALYQGDFHLAVQLSQQALEQLEAGESYLRHAAHFAQSLSLLSEGDPDIGSRAMEETVRSSRSTGNSLVGVLALSSLAENYKKTGQLHRANQVYQQALRMAVDSEGIRLPIAGRALIGASDIVREWNELEKARHMVEEGMKISELTGQMVVLQGYINLARIMQSQGNLQEAQEAIQKAGLLALASDFTELDDLMVEMIQVRLAIAQGNLAVAERWVKDHGVEEEETPSFGSVTKAYIQEHIRKYEQILLARLWLAQERPGEALALLETILPRFERINRIWAIIEIRILKSLAFHDLGNEGNALTEIERALSLAEPEGFMRSFLDEGKEVASLLVKLRGRKTVASEFLERLLTAFGEKLTRHALLGSIANQEEPLSVRELDVLRLLDTSLSSEEIAEELVVSVNTVRSHIKSIYQKLNVHSRHQALSRARELDYI